MIRTSVFVITTAAIFAVAPAHAQGSAAPIEGNPTTVRPAPAPPPTTGPATTGQSPRVQPTQKSPYGAKGGPSGEQNPDRVAPRPD
jgi:hypothetical protein